MLSLAVRQTPYLAAQPINMIQLSRLCALACFALTVAACAHALLCLTYLIAQLLQAGGDLTFGAVGVWIDSPSQPVSRPLNAVA